MKTNQRFTVHFDGGKLAQIKDLATSEQVCPSEFIRRAVDERIARIQSKTPQEV